MNFKGYLDKLKKGLTNLPGIGSKTAERLAFFLISEDKKIALDLAQLITNTVNSVKKCSVCNMLSVDDPCTFCADKERNDNLLCVVEKTQDVYLIESLNHFDGRYFVLGNLISPIDGIGPENINFPKLEKYISDKNIAELILAINPNSAGETTIAYIISKLKGKNINITKLAIGLPAGGDIEYSSKKTLENAFINRSSCK